MTFDLSSFPLGQTDPEGKPIKVATYIVRFTMNEDNYDRAPESHKVAFAEAIQDAIDDGFTDGLRYDALEFNVLSREEHA